MTDNDASEARHDQTSDTASKLVKGGGRVAAVCCGDGWDDLTTKAALVAAVAARPVSKSDTVEDAGELVASIVDTVTADRSTSGWAWWTGSGMPAPSIERTGG